MTEKPPRIEYVLTEFYDLDDDNEDDAVVEMLDELIEHFGRERFDGWVDRAHQHDNRWNERVDDELRDMLDDDGDA